jgi:N,N-dimethylformamidase beta subunit-like protein/flagellar hook capping protein FlgD
MKCRVPLSLLLALLVTLSAPTAKAAVSAYVWPQSVRQGETAQLYVSTDAATFNVTVTRQGLVPTSYMTATGQPGVNQAVPESSWANGCGWAPSLAIPTTGGWPSGVYVVTVNAGSNSAEAIFVVREDDPGSTGSILMEICTTTYEAYNNFPSPNPPYKSLYEGGSSDGVRAYFVSFKRPYSQNDGQGLFPNWELPFIKWAEAEGYNLEYCVGPDLAQDPALESHYALLLSVGHDEYWSKEMRNTVENRIHSGRNVAFFSANTCWWQIRFNPAGDQIICYKSKTLDPLFGVDNSRVTVNWYADPVNRPENWMTGLSYRGAGYVNSSGYYPASEGYGDYTAYHTNHWVYGGTGLHDGDEYGYTEQIVGYETDGCLVQWVNGLPAPTGMDGTPLNFVVLGYSPASYGNATMGIYVYHQARVFNAASIYWANGLDADDAIVEQITHNVVDSLLQVGTVVGIGDEPPAIFSLQNAPNPFSASTRIAFQLPAGDRVRLAVFDVGGRRVKTLLDELMSAGPHAISWSGVDERGRQVAPGIYFYRLEAGPLLRVGKALKER